MDGVAPLLVAMVPFYFPVQIKKDQSKACGERKVVGGGIFKGR